MNAFNHAYNTAYAGGGNTREAKLYKALELVVYCTGSPILTMRDSSYPLLNQPGQIEAKSDAELDEIIAELEAMPDDLRKQMHEKAKPRLPPRIDPLARWTQGGPFLNQDDSAKKFGPNIGGHLQC
jgi:hypothetical protein